MADSDNEGERPTPFIGVATFKYNSPHAGDLSFPKKATVHVLREEDEDWYFGEYDGKQGIFPKNFVSFVEPLQAEHGITAASTSTSAAVAEPSAATTAHESLEHDAQEQTEDPLAASMHGEPAETEPVAQEVEDEDEGAEPQDEPETQHTDEPEPELEPEPEPAEAAQVPDPEPAPTPVSVPVAAPIPTATKPPPPARATVAPPPVRSSTASSADKDPVVEPSAQSFRDRLAAFNKAAAPPPIPKPLPKPSNFVRRPYMDKPAVVPPPKPAPAAPVSTDTDISPAVSASSNVPDAVESPKEAEIPRRSVGSLRDRITALQSVPMPGMPGVPGRPPPRLPKKAPTTGEEMDDTPHTADDDTAPSSEVTSPIADKEAAPSAGNPDDEEDATPAVDESEEAEEQAEPTEEEKELQRRQALAQRMAALGGARIGLAPLPKRAAPPKRRPPPAEPKAEETERPLSAVSASTAEETVQSEQMTSPVAPRPTSIVSTEEDDIPPAVPTRRPTSETESPAMTSVADETDIPPPIPKARPASFVGAKRAVPPVPSRSDTVSPDPEEPEDVPPPVPSNRPSSRPSSQYGVRPPIPAGVAPPTRRGSGKVASAPIPPKRGSTSDSRPTSMVSNDSEGAPHIPARPTSVVVDSEDEDVPPPIPASRPVPAPPADYIMEDDEEEEEPAVAQQPSSPIKREAVPPPTTSPPPLPKSPPPAAPIAVATGAAAAGAAVATAAVHSPVAKDSLGSPHVSKSPVVDVPAPPPVAPAQTPQLAQDIDLDQASAWWLSDPVQVPSSLRGRQDIHYEVDGSSKMKKGKWIVTLDLHVLFADLSQTIITVSYAQGDTSPSAATLSQRHNPPPPPPSPADLQKWSSTLGSGVLGFAFQQTGHTVGDGSSAALIKEAIRTVRSALRPIGNASFGHLLYEAQEGHANQNEENEIRPGDIAVLSKAKFHGRRGIASYTHFAGFDSRGPQVSIVTEFDKSKRKIRVLEQRDSTDENGSSGRHGIVESNSYKVTDVKSGSVRVYRLMDSSAIPEWIEEDD